MGGSAVLELENEKGDPPNFKLTPISTITSSKTAIQVIFLAISISFGSLPVGVGFVTYSRAVCTKSILKHNRVNQ